MEKSHKNMPIIGRLFFLILFLNTLLFSGVNFMNQAIVKKGELCLSFSKNFNKSNVKHFTLSNPHRDIYDFKNTQLAHKRVPLGLGNNVRIAQNNSNMVRVVIEGLKKHTISAYQPHLSKKEYYISLSNKKKEI